MNEDPTEDLIAAASQRPQGDVIEDMQREVEYHARRLSSLERGRDESRTMHIEKILAHHSSTNEHQNGALNSHLELLDAQKTRMDKIYRDIDKLDLRMDEIWKRDRLFQSALDKLSSDNRDLSMQVEQMEDLMIRDVKEEFWKIPALILGLAFMAMTAAFIFMRTYYAK